MLKRINIHLEEAHTEELNTLAARITQKYMGARNYVTISRADLIRFAISRTFGMGYPNVHISKEELWRLVKKTKKGLSD